MKKIVIHIIFTLCCSFVFAQIVPVRDFRNIRGIEKSLYNLQSKGHSSFRNYYFDYFEDIVMDSSGYLHGFPSFQYTKDIGREKFGVSILPVYEAFYGLNFSDIKENMFYMNIGALVDITLSNKLGLSYLFSANLFELPDYLFSYDFIDPVLKGYGKVHGKNYNYSYNHDFRLSWKPFDFLMLEIANSKNFFGDGYRSFLLSDNAKNYPFIKLETQFLDFKYSCIWAMQDYFYKDSITDLYDTNKKFTVFHYLDWRITRRFSIGIFESVVTKNSKSLDFEYFNPVIFFRPVEFSLGSEDNALLGIYMKYSFNSNNAIYLQGILDDIIVKQLFNDIKHTFNSNYTGEYGWFANKWALQLGFKSFDIFKVNDLDFFTEINVARPYIYSHIHIEQNYAHYGQSLAHPIGANFIESVSGLNYYREKFNINLKFMYATLGMDTSANTHYGQNIFLPTMDGVNLEWPYQVQSYYNTILQGNRTDIFTLQGEFSYYVRSQRNLSLNCGILIRNVNTKRYNNFSGYFYIGLRTNISRLNMLY